MLLIKNCFPYRGDAVCTSELLSSNFLSDILYLCYLPHLSLIQSILVKITTLGVSHNSTSNMSELLEVNDLMRLLCLSYQSCKRVETLFQALQACQQLFFVTWNLQREELRRWGQPDVHKRLSNFAKQFIEFGGVLELWDWQQPCDFQCVQQSCISPACSRGRTK
jgi:hypothetical protein